MTRSLKEKLATSAPARQATIEAEADRLHEERGGTNMRHHSIFLMRGQDASGQNDFRVRSWDWAH